MRSLAECQLYTFVDLAYVEPAAVERVTAQLCDGGSDLIQLRAKDWPVEHVSRLAERILPICQTAQVRLVINDHWKLALALGASTCHLGQEDFFDAGLAHRRQLWTADSSLELGLSSHAPLQAGRAVAAGADYVAIGPVYPTPTKPTAPAVTLEYVRWAAANLTVPWFAIGGIHLENLEEVLESGARRICVVSAILKAPHIVAACQAFKNRLASAAS